MANEMTLIKFCDSCGKNKELHDIFSVDENMYRGIDDRLHLVEFYHEFSDTIKSANSSRELPITIITGS